MTTERDGHILCDYDNLITDGTETHWHYKRVLAELYCKKMDLPLAEILPLFLESESEIREHPDCHIFYAGGFPVGSLKDDHILLTRGAGILTYIKWHQKYGKPQIDTESLGEIMTQLYKESYPIAGVTYRPGALEAIADYYKTKRFAIVSGSPKTAIQKQLAAPLAKLNVDVFAVDIQTVAKSHIDPSHKTHLQASVQPQDFPHPVHLRRPSYDEFLRSLPRGVAFSVSDTIGDLAIFEFDTESEAQTLLLRTDFLTWWVEKYYQNGARGRLVETIADIRDQIDSFL